jgi:hypothetical protein
VEAAAELLKAAILLRDLAGAMPAGVMASMPPDLRNRLVDYTYQGAFDQLPENVRERARVIALADPMIQEARRIDAARRALG